MFDDGCMARAIALSAGFRGGDPLTPFGAVVALDGRIVGEGVSAVVRDRDPTAHAEVVAIRRSCRARDRHQLPGAVLYCSGYPCPLCLMACYWADIGEVYFAADLADSAAVGFEDSRYYDQLKLDAADRSVVVAPAGDAFRRQAASILREWKRGWTERGATQ